VAALEYLLVVREKVGSSSNEDEWATAAGSLTWEGLSRRPGAGPPSGPAAAGPWRRGCWHRGMTGWRRSLAAGQGVVGCWSQPEQGKD
jgi:hypothetical protein